MYIKSQLFIQWIWELNFKLTIEIKIIYVEMQTIFQMG